MQPTDNLDSVGSPNRDPLSGEEGAHPVGTGLGAAAGGMAAGAAIGTVAGPVGTMIGAAAGAVVGGLAGKGVAESVDPTVDDEYWRQNYAKRPYVASGASYDDYAPAYGMGRSYFHAHSGKTFDEVEGTMGRDWESAKGGSSLSWEHAKSAVRDAWDRMTSQR